MKSAIFVMLACLVVVGCEKPDFPVAAAGPVVRSDGIASLTITGNDMMKFDVNAFAVKSGEKVRLTFRNVGNMPITTMGHDLVILKQGKDYKQFANDVVALNGSDASGKLIPSLADQTIAYTGMVGPGEQQVIEFTAPMPGSYSYLCIFPGHFVFMHGVMTVQ